MKLYVSHSSHHKGSICSPGHLLLHGCSKVFGTLVLSILLGQIPWSVSLNVSKGCICTILAEDLDDPVGRVFADVRI